MVLFFAPITFQFIFYITITNFSEETVPPCEDLNDFCATWAANGACYRQYLIDNCRKSCDLCPHQSEFLLVFMGQLFCNFVKPVHDHEARLKQIELLLHYVI